MCRVNQILFFNLSYATLNYRVRDPEMCSLNAQEWSVFDVRKQFYLHKEKGTSIGSSINHKRLKLYSHKDAQLDMKLLGRGITTGQVTGLRQLGGFSPYRMA